MAYDDVCISCEFAGAGLEEVAMRAKVSRQTLLNVERADGRFSLVVAASVCEGMGLSYEAASVRAV